MNLFPSGWRLPLPKGFKPISNLSDHHFPPKTERISLPAPAPRTAPVIPVIPVEELCLGSVNDFTEIDRMLNEMDNPSAEAKARQLFQMVSTIKDNLEKNIRVIQDAPIAENDNVSRADILRLLRLFLNFSRNVENYCKEIQCCR